MMVREITYARRGVLFECRGDRLTQEAQYDFVRNVVQTE